MPNWFTPCHFPADPATENPTNNSPQNPTTAPGPEAAPYNWTRHHFPAVLTAILAALQPHPEAHAAVRLALRHLYQQLHHPPTTPTRDVFPHPPSNTMC